MASSPEYDYDPRSLKQCLRSRWTSLLSEPIRPVFHRDPHKSQLRSFLFLSLLSFIFIIFIVVLTLRLSFPTVSVSTVSRMSQSEYAATLLVHPELSCACATKQISAVQMLAATGDGTLSAQVQAAAAAISQMCFMLQSAPINDVAQQREVQALIRILYPTIDTFATADTWTAIYMFLPLLKKDACISFALSANAIVASINPNVAVALSQEEFLVGASIQFAEWYQNFLSSYFRTVRSVYELAISLNELAATANLFNTTNTTTTISSSSSSSSTLSPSIRIFQNSILNSPQVLQATVLTLTNFTDGLYASTAAQVSSLALALYPGYFLLCQAQQCTYLAPEPWYNTVLDSMGGMGACYAILLVLVKWIYEFQARDSWHPDWNEEHRRRGANTPRSSVKGSSQPVKHGEIRPTLKVTQDNDGLSEPSRLELSRLGLYGPHDVVSTSGGTVIENCGVFTLNPVNPPSTASFRSHNFTQPDTFKEIIAHGQT